EGAHVAWLDQVLPMYRKDMFALEASIGMQKSTNHRFPDDQCVPAAGCELEAVMNPTCGCSQPSTLPAGVRPIILQRTSENLCPAEIVIRLFRLGMPRILIEGGSDTIS